MALSHFPQPSSPSNSLLPLSDAYVVMAPADLAPAVGYRFHPTDQELVGHYLRHKLKADAPSIHDIIPEIGVCKYEPWDLLDRAASASATKFDESQCFFFSPRDYKYSNSNRSNRSTSHGFWKVTGRDRKIRSKDTNKVIGTKKTLVYHEGRFSRGIKTNWVIHEYHDAQLSNEERTYVLCWLRKDNKKKTKEKTHQLVDDERRTINQVKSQANTCMNSEEHYFSDRSSMIQVSSQSNEVIDPMIQPFESNEAVDSMIQISSLSNQAEYSDGQTSSQSNDNSTKPISLESYEAIDSDEYGFSLFESFDSGEFDLASLLQSPRVDEGGPSGIMATSDMPWHEA